MRVRVIALTLCAILIASAAACRSTEADRPVPSATSTSVAATEQILAPTPTAPPTVAPSEAPPRSAGIRPPDISARAAIVLDDASASVLFELNGETPLAPASLTKIATAVVALESGDLDRTVAVTVDSRAMRGSTVMGLLPGDRFTVRDLLYGMLLPSGNDAAVAIGRALAGSDSAFVEQMNALAARLSLHETHFVNPHGLSARGHETSAHDLAVLSRYAMSMPAFAQIVATTDWIASGSRTIPLHNINSFLYAYPGADGLKTGYTRSAGSTLAASAVHGDHRLFVILLNDGDRERDASALMDWAFDNFTWQARS